MPANVYKSGTTGAADGTLVTSGTKFVFTAVDTVLDLHVRCAADTYSADAVFDLPSDGDVEISLDGGSTWKDVADNPIAIVTGIGIGGLDLGDLNHPFKIRQHASTATVSGQIATDGTFTACTALADVTGFTATPGRQKVSLAWSAVANRTYYRIDRATNSGFTTGVALDISPNHTAVTFTDTGLTAGTTYYYRIKAVGTYRYSDSASYATANAAVYATGFSSATTSASSNPIDLVEGPDNNIWATLNGGGKIARITPDAATVDEFAIPSSGTGPVGICVLGGNIWYCNNGTSAGITKISTFSGTPTQTHYTSGFTAPYDCIAGPDGNLWVTDGQYFRKVNPSTGAVTASYDAGSGHDLRFLATDGTDLFASDRHSTPKIARCTTAGTVTTTNTTDAASDPVDICWDAASSRLYMVAQALGKIYKITAGATQTFDAAYTVNASSQITCVVVGPDGRIYTNGANASFKNIYSMASGGGSFTTETAISAGTSSFKMILHSSGAIWVAEFAAAAKVSRYVKA